MPPTAVRRRTITEQVVEFWRRIFCIVCGHMGFLAETLRQTNAFNNQQSDLKKKKERQKTSFVDSKTEMMQHNCPF